MRGSTPARLVHDIRFIAHVVKQRRELAKAMRRTPRPISWEFAAPRLMPFLCGPCIDDPEFPRVRATAPPGCAVEFGVDVGGVFPIVDARVAERWECTPAQLLSVGLDNLHRRASCLTRSTVKTATFSGRLVRLLEGVPYAASLLLAQDELMRLFGRGDQVFGAPSSSTLLSFALDTPPLVVAHTVIDFEMSEQVPLMLDPFMLIDGELIWQPADED